MITISNGILFYFHVHFVFPNRHLDKQQQVLLTHGDSITDVGSRLKLCAISSSQVIAGIWNEETVFGVQFHPEVRSSFLRCLNEIRQQQHAH